MSLFLPWTLQGFIEHISVTSYRTITENLHASWKEITLPALGWTYGMDRQRRGYPERTNATLESSYESSYGVWASERSVTDPVKIPGIYSHNIAIIIGRLSNNNLLSCPFFTLKISRIWLLPLQITHYSDLSRFLICSLRTRLMYWLKERSSSSASSLILSIMSASRVMLTLFFNGFMQALLLLISITNRRYNIEK